MKKPGGLWFGLTMGLMLLLTACPGIAPEVYVLDKDPRILSGNWSAKLIERSFLNVAAVGPDNSLIATYEDRTQSKLTIRNAQTGSVVKSLSFAASKIAFQSSQVLVGIMTGSTGLIGFLNIETGQFNTFELPQGAHGGFLTQDGKKVFWLEEGKLAGINLETRQPIPSVSPSLSQYGHVVVMSSLGTWFAVMGFDNEKVAVWSSTGKKLQIATPAQTNVQAFFSTDEKKLIVMGASCSIAVWDIASGNQDSSFLIPNCSSRYDSPVRFGGLYSQDGSLILLLTPEYQNNTLTRYRLLWVRGSQIEQSLELPLGTLSSFERYGLYLPLFFGSLGSDILLSYEGTLGRIAGKTYVWKNQGFSSSISLNLTAKYIDENSYSISGTAQIDNQTFSVQGEGYARNNSKIVVQTAPIPPPFLQFRLKLFSNNEVKWSLAGQTEAYGSAAYYLAGAAPGDKAIELNPYGYSYSYFLDQSIVASLRREP